MSLVSVMLAVLPLTDDAAEVVATSMVVESAVMSFSVTEQTAPVGSPVMTFESPWPSEKVIGLAVKVSPQTSEPWNLQATDIAYE